MNTKSAITKILATGILFLNCNVHQIAYSQDKYLSESAATALVGASLLENLNPKTREKIHRLKTDPAWVHLLTPAKRSPFANLLRDQIGMPSTSATEQNPDNQRKEIMLRAENMLESSSLPLDAYQKLGSQMAKQLAVSLAEEIEGLEPKGARFALAVGHFQFFPRKGASPDPKLDDALQNVLDHLSQERGIRRKFALLPYKETSPERIIERISGGAANWLDPDMGNFEELRAKNFHPADIFILTGVLLEQRKGEQMMEYLLKVRVAYPVESGSAPIIVKANKFNYLFHPTRYWLTEEEDALLALK